VITHKTYLLIVLAIAALLLNSCSSQKASTFQKSRALLDTLITITVAADSRQSAEKAIDDSFEVIREFGDLVNFYSDESEISEINRNAGIRAVKVSQETFDLIEKALFISEKSEGAFDPTIGSEIQLWDFVNKIRPSDEEIRQRLGAVNYRNVVLDRKKSTVFLKKENMLLDLGGIAKGYAADIAVKSLKHNGISSGLVAVAGDIKSFGRKPENKPWIVGIRNPRQKGADDEIIVRLPLNEKAISTSGDYERYFILDGQRFHHIIDPRTGYPSNASRSVSIIADDGYMTDALATALFIAGPEKGMELAKEMLLEAVIIGRDGEFHITPGLEGKLTFERNN
jgi:FAD:protein FMN transferase